MARITALFSRSNARTVRLTMAVAAVFSCSPVAWCADWYVDVHHPTCISGTGGPSDPFCIIADAIGAATTGDTIHIAAGTYLENLVLDKDLTLIGTDGLTVTIVDGSGNGPAVAVDPAISALLLGLTLRNGSPEGLRVGAGSGVVEVQESVVENNSGQGIRNSDGATVLLTHSTVSGNSSDGIYSYNGSVTLCNTLVACNSFHGVRGRYTSVKIYDSTVSDNSGRGVELQSCFAAVFDHSLVHSNAGGVNLSESSATLSYCQIQDNSGVTDGGGIRAQTALLTLTNSTITGNSASNRGGGVFAYETYATLTSSTIAENSATTSGGGLFRSSGMVELDHVIIADNLLPAGSPDCSGSLVSLGYNLIGDTTGCSVSGDLSGNQLNVNPQFVGSGDSTLQPTSPAIDAGSSTATCNRDVAGNVRILDGDLDGTPRIDLGALEFSHVHLDITGNATPGGNLTVTPTGTTGMPTFLWVGTGAGLIPFSPHGCLFVDLGAGPWSLIPLGALPIAPLLGTLPLDVPAGLLLVFQAHAISSGTGNLSRSIEKVVQS